MSEWIKVSERLPEKSSHNDHSKSVLVFRESNKCQNVATYDTMNKVWFCFFSGWEIGAVTHWMPLPAAPEAE